MLKKFVEASQDHTEDHWRKSWCGKQTWKIETIKLLRSWEKTMGTLKGGEHKWRDVGDIRSTPPTFPVPWTGNCLQLEVVRSWVPLFAVHLFKSGWGISQRRCCSDQTLSDLANNRKASARKALKRILKWDFGTKLLAALFLPGENRTIGGGGATPRFENSGI